MVGIIVDISFHRSTEDEAHAYLDRFEFHYVPKNGSWLNMAVIKLNVFK